MRNSADESSEIANIKLLIGFAQRYGQKNKIKIEARAVIHKEALDIYKKIELED